MNKLGDRCEVVVVGAGPAGLAAATLLAEHGLVTRVVDEQPAEGGQIFRGITASPLRRPEILGDDYWHGAGLVRAFRVSGAEHLPGAVVWAARQNEDGSLDLAVSVRSPDAQAGSETRMIAARALVVATGAMERPMPIPGWTLPGVMSAGGAQILLKTAGLVPIGRTVLAGSGPLLWLLARQYLDAGVAIDALLDTTPRGRLARVLRHAPGFALSPYLAKGIGLVRAVRRRVRVVEHVSALAATGADRVEAVCYEASQARGVSTAALPVENLLLHQGVVPNVHLAAALGCALQWNDAQACFAPVIDAWGGTSIPNVFIAGDGGGIAGATAAEAQGRLAALAVANALGAIDGATRDRSARTHRAALASTVRGRAFLDALYRPADAFRLPEGDTIVCRCEEVTAAQVINAARAGCMGPNQTKSFLRCGMGPCQGRFCGLTVTELIARERAISPDDVGHFRCRFPVKPVTLGEMASLPQTDESDSAVIRLQGGTH